MWHQIDIIGNLGKDPEMRYTPSGQAVTSFSVASSRSYSKNGETVKETIWFRCEAWGKVAEVANQYLHKGSKVLIIGRLKPDVATGGPKIWSKQDGSSGASFEIVVSELKFLDPKEKQQTATPYDEASPDVGDGENLP
jgi:single-strand DNA-binding protein